MVDLAPTGPTSRFVGRRDELRWLLSAVADGRTGDATPLLITGEAGIGKTRLLREFSREAATSGARVLWGGGTAEAAPVFWPWVRALSPLFAELTVTEHASVSNDPILSAVMPPGTAHAPRPTVISEPTEESIEADEVVRAASLAALLADAPSDSSIVVVIEDLHWADDRSVRLFQQLGHELTGSSVLLVGSLRDPQQDEARNSVTRLLEDTTFSALPVGGLSGEDVAQLVDATGGPSLDQTSITELSLKSGGNPLFARELLALYRDGEVSLRPDQAPETALRVLGMRCDRLAQVTRELLSVAAISGHEFIVDGIMQLANASRDEVVNALEEGTTAHLVAPIAQPDHWAFVHDLTRQALLKSLPDGRRWQLHLRCADLLEEALPPAPAATIAHHLAEAAALAPEIASRALEHSVKAAEAALELGGFVDATRQYERCLELLDLGATGLSRGEVLRRMARSLLRTAAAESSKRWLEAIEELRTEEDPLEWITAVDEARWTVSFFALEHAEELRREALTALDEDSDHGLRARLILPHIIDHGAESDLRAAEAEAMAREHDLADVLATILDRRAHLALREHRFDDAIPVITEAAEVYHRLGKRFHAAHLKTDVTISYLLRGQLDAAAQAADEAASYGREQTWWFHRSRAHRASVALLRNDRELAAALVDRLPGHIPAHARAIAACRFGRVEAALGEAITARTRMLAGSRQAALPHGIAATAYACNGVRDAARRELRAWAEYFASMTYVIFAVDAFLGAATALLLLGSRGLKQSVYDSVSKWRDVRAGHQIPGGLDFPRGVLALQLDRPVDAKRWFEIGRDWARREGCPAELALNLSGLASIAVYDGDSARRGLLLGEVAAIFAEHGFGPPPELRALDAWLKDEPVSDTPVTSHETHAPTVGNGADSLTPREREVLSLVADGLTNREVGKSLTISHHTVTRHLHNAYSKLGVSARAAAVALLVANTSIGATDDNPRTGDRESA